MVVLAAGGAQSKRIGRTATWEREEGFMRRQTKIKKEKRNKGQISRREFFKDAGLMVGSAAIGSTALLGAAPVKTASAQGTSGPVELKVYDPAGAREVTVLHAPRLNTLEGKTICELSNDGWQHDRTFPLIRELLQRQFPTVKIIPYTEFPRGRGAGEIDDDKTAKMVKDKRCDAVIVGNAG
jgi:hypothetical protein